ncbi:MAG: hypothetical protein IKO85_02310 [Bacteroidaceae bacterium]|nr:hypothetical protein [Bacteroidaceae bacterium]
MQSLLVTLILALCVVYTVRRLWHRFTAPPAADARCEGCPLADTCTHHHPSTPSTHEHQHHRNRQDCPRGTACDCCH